MQQQYEAREAIDDKRGEIKGTVDAHRDAADLQQEAIRNSNRVK